MTPWKIRKNYVFIHLTPLLRNYRFFGVSPIANATPRNTTGHGKERRDNTFDNGNRVMHIPLPLCSRLTR